MKLSNRDLWLLLHAARQRMDWLNRLEGQSAQVKSLADEMAELHARLTTEVKRRD